MTTDPSAQRLVHLSCGAMTVGRVSLRQQRWRSTPAVRWERWDSRAVS